MKKWIPLGLIASIALLFFLFGGHGYFQLDQIKELEGDLVTFVEAAPVQALMIFIVIYVLVGISMVPGLIALDLVAGYLFGQILSITCVVIGGIVGSLILFFSARYAFGDFWLKRNTSLLQKVQDGFNRNQISYLLLVRILPIPFGVVNIALGMLDVKFKRFMWTTLIGLIPVAFVYTQAGTGLGKILQSGEPISAGHFMNPQMIVAFLGIAFLSLIPVFLRKKKDIANE